MCGDMTHEFPAEERVQSWISTEVGVGLIPAGKEDAGR